MFGQKKTESRPLLSPRHSVCKATIYNIITNYDTYGDFVSEIDFTPFKECIQDYMSARYNAISNAQNPPQLSEKFINRIKHLFPPTKQHITENFRREPYNFKVAVQIHGGENLSKFINVLIEMMDDYKEEFPGYFESMIKIVTNAFGHRGIKLEKKIPLTSNICNRYDSPFKYCEIKNNPYFSMTEEQDKQLQRIIATDRDYSWNITENTYNVTPFGISFFRV